LAAGTMIRRVHHDRYDQRLRRLCSYYALTPSALLEGQYPAQRLARLRALPLSSLEVLLEPLLLKCGSAAPLASAVRDLCLELGLIDVWQRRLLGQAVSISLRHAVSRPDGVLNYFHSLRFVLRARSARNLGLLYHHASWPILARALYDPHPDVQQVALRSLAALSEPQSFPAILERLGKSVMEKQEGLSVHSLKAAMARFPLAQVPQLLPGLRHTHPHVRLAALEILREMAKSDPAGKRTLLQYRTLFDHELGRLASDADAQVGVMASDLLAQFARALPSSDLCRRLQDPHWAVRMAAVQTLAQPPGIFGVAEMAGFLCDPHVMVRQAAIQALLACGPEGVSRLYEQFVETEDEALREQMVGELERSGFILSLLQNFGATTGSLETRVVERYLTLRASQYLHAEPPSDSVKDLLQRVLEMSGGEREPPSDARVRLVSAPETARQPDPTAHGQSKLAL